MLQIINYINLKSSYFRRIDYYINSVHIYTVKPALTTTPIRQPPA